VVAARIPRAASIDFLDLPQAPRIRASGAIQKGAARQTESNVADRVRRPAELSLFKSSADGPQLAPSMRAKPDY